MLRRRAPSAVPASAVMLVAAAYSGERQSDTGDATDSRASAAPPTTVTTTIDVDGGPERLAITPDGASSSIARW